MKIRWDEKDDNNKLFFFEVPKICGHQRPESVFSVMRTKQYIKMILVTLHILCIKFSINIFIILQSRKSHEIILPLLML